MLVSLIVGTIRNQVEMDSDPLRMLELLNRRLIGPGNANAMCLAMRVAPDGGVTLANAGHLPPYLNGAEIVMEGALPLGIMTDAEFPVVQLLLQPGDRLTLMTDGIVEAQSEKRELFSFAWATELVRQDRSAVEIRRRGAELRTKRRHHCTARRVHRSNRRGAGALNDQVALFYTSAGNGRIQCGPCFAPADLQSQRRISKNLL